MPQPLIFLPCYNRSIPSSTYVGLLLLPAIPFFSHLKDPAVYPYFDIYRTGYPKKEDREAPLSVMLSAQYPALSLCEPRIISRIIAT
jgi:hypothetical protein